MKLVFQTTERRKLTTTRKRRTCNCTMRDTGMDTQMAPAYTEWYTAGGLLITDLPVMRCPECNWSILSHAVDHIVSMQDIVVRKLNKEKELTFNEYLRLLEN